jgi:hypothetical protein
MSRPGRTGKPLQPNGLARARRPCEMAYIRSVKIMSSIKTIDCSRVSLIRAFWANYPRMVKTKMTGGQSKIDSRQEESLAG